MLKSGMEHQLNKYTDKINLDEALQKIDDFLYDHELEFGNIVCMFIYKKEDRLELSFLSSPSVSDRLEIEYQKED